MASKSWSWPFTSYKGAGQGHVSDTWTPFGQLALVAVLVVAGVVLIAYLKGEGRGSWVSSKELKELEEREKREKEEKEEEEEEDEAEAEAAEAEGRYHSLELPKSQQQKQQRQGAEESKGKGRAGGRSKYSLRSRR